MIEDGVRLLTAVILAAALLVPAHARANGRFPQTVDLVIQRTDQDRRLLAVTFGLLVTTNGADYRWTCEAALGYSGTFDPEYALLDDGTLVVGAFDGVRVSTDDGCTWNLVPDLAGAQAGAIELGADGRLWVAAARDGDSGLWYSDDGGASFTRTALPGGDTAWISLAVAPSDPRRVYVTGFAAGTGDLDAGAATRARMFVSSDGGASFSALALDDIAFDLAPEIYAMGVWPDDPDVVFVRLFEADGIGESLYRSTDAGAGFTHVLDIDTPIEAFHIVADGSRMIVGGKSGVRVSTDMGTSFTARATPLLGCANQLADGTVLGCGANWEPDFLALGASADGLSWTSTLEFRRIAGPLVCPAGTVQETTCRDQYYDMVCPFAEAQECFVAPDAGPPAPPDGAVVFLPDAGRGGGGGGCGCASRGTGGGAAAVLGLAAAWVSRRRRARRSAPATRSRGPAGGPRRSPARRPA